MNPRPPDWIQVDPLLREALAEDLGRAGDLTSAAVVPADAQALGRIVARRAGRLAGVEIALRTFWLLDPDVRCTERVTDGSDIAAGEIIAEIEGRTRTLLGAERVALNLLGRLSGVATATATMVAAVAGTGARIADTRKTTPLLRALDKYAVRCGGGVNHRFGLDDAILIKDNHVAAAGSVREALRRARAAVGHMVKVEIEVDSLAQLDEAVAHGADIVLLDNFPPEHLRAAVERVAGNAILEASGGITPGNVREFAATGVDVISAGWLTHSAPALDVSLELTPLP